MFKNRIVAASIIILSLCLVLLCLSPVVAGESTQTCLDEAKHIDLEGASNLYQVSSAVYRSAQPEPEGFVDMEKMGIKTVVNLRKTHSDDEDMECTSMTPVSIPMWPWDIDEEEVIEFLKLTQNPEATPILLHCRHGADRTGAMIAAYRVVMCNWDLDAAIEEMKHGGFHYHSIWWTLPREVEKLDFEFIRQQLKTE